MKLAFTLLFSLCVSLALNAQCPVEKKLMDSKWVLYMSDMIGIFEFATNNHLNLYSIVDDSLKFSNSKKWHITTDCRYLIMENERDSFIMNFTNEGFLLLETEGETDKFGRIRPEDGIFLRQIPLSTTELTGYLKKLKTDYPEVYYTHIIKAEQYKYINQYKISQDSLNIVEAQKATADAAAVISEPMDISQITRTVVDTGATNVLEEPSVYDSNLTEEMKDFKITSSGGTPFWRLNVKDGFAILNEGDSPKYEYELIKLPMMQFLSQRIDEIEVKTIQFKDADTGLEILLMISDNKKNMCSNGMSDSKFRYTVQFTFLDKKYEGCGADK